MRAARSRGARVQAVRRSSCSWSVRFVPP